MQDDTDYVKKLKCCTAPEDWPETRLRLLDAESCRLIRLDILEEEELFQELFDAVRLQPERLPPGVESITDGGWR